ncbi:hypothetical protein [Sinomicrobium pectinilyticum]|uniref:DUF3575 domain-containing protein n=1 Tax=Sinomicrobium pectinilyticum TaxID=1084421 RepID=A0A3N0E7D9_SINP1|nr:hypothetical protein [Sinomicrobium pectinilyticum]RNL83765.1 hypothetical protein ED312_14535 [Sinomicrobium pectinilyticum]
MKNYLFVFAFFLAIIHIEAQEVSIEKSIFGIQTGFLGIWVHNEAKLSSKISLRSEIGLDAGFQSGEYYQAVGVYKGMALIPSITLEPRYYYNLEKRNGKGRSYAKNSGNFLTLRMKYFPDWFVIASDKNRVHTTEQISFIPKWGLRRTLGEHFTYEAGIGIGYYHNFDESNIVFDKSGVMMDFHLRIGYTF